MNAPLPIFSAFVDGKDSESSGSSFELINPQDGSIIGRIAESGTAGVDRAVKAAARAFAANRK